MKLNLYCINCKKTLALKKYKRIWCPCNPTAPFIMQTREGDKILNAIFKNLKNSISPHPERAAVKGRAEK